LKRCLIIALAALALPLLADDQTPASKPVATINGEVVTAAKLDRMYSNLSPAMRTQYNETGGKAAFLENYLRKRLLVQEAIKSGFDKRPDIVMDMEAAKEGALFDRYVRDVVTPNVVTDAEVRKFYDDHLTDFATPEKVHVRHIVITGNGSGPHPKSDEEALAKIKEVSELLHRQMAEVKADDPAVAARIRLSYFGEDARKYSEDATAASGGDLGWVVKGQLDPDFEGAAFKLEKGFPSGIVKTRFGYHLIIVEDKQAAGTEPFESARPTIREYLMAQHAEDVMQTVTRLTNELRAQSKITLYPENIK